MMLLPFSTRQTLAFINAIWSHLPPPNLRFLLASKNQHFFIYLFLIQASVQIIAARCLELQGKEAK